MLFDWVWVEQVLRAASGFPEYGCELSLEKTLVNFPTDYIDVQNVTMSNCVLCSRLVLRLKKVRVKRSYSP